MQLTFEKSDFCREENRRLVIGYSMHSLPYKRLSEARATIAEIFT